MDLTEDYSDARFDLIYGRGSTSHSSVKVEYEDDNGNTVTVIKDLDFCVYTKNADYLAQNSPYIYGMDAFNGGNSFSIVDVDDALPFSVKVAWESRDLYLLETVSIGNWGYDTYDWGYYDNLPGNLGGNTDGRDLAFSLIFKGTLSGNNANMPGYANLGIFTYGFTQTSTDSNLAGVPITYHNTPKVHVDVLDLWIQAGAVEGSGMFISIGAMDSGILGVRGLDVTSYESAQRAIERVGDATEKISEQRSAIGAQQNRLEHARAIDDNISENSQAAESRIRDTDMATEMVNQAKHRILEQAGQSMLAQANQTPNGVLQLLNLQ